MEPARRRATLPSRRLGDDVGATMVEYGLVLALVALVVAGGALLLGQGIGDRLGGAAAIVAGNSPADPDDPDPDDPQPGGGGPAAAAKPGGPNANAANGAANSNGNSAHNK